MWICLIVVLAVAAFLRLYALDRHGFNSDEAVYAGQAASISGSRTFLAYFPIYRAHPLLYQAILSVVYRFVLSDFAARLAVRRLRDWRRGRSRYALGSPAVRPAGRRSSPPRCSRSCRIT